MEKIIEKTLYLLIAFVGAFSVGMIYVILDQQDHSKLVDFGLICFAMFSIVVISKSVSRI